MCGISGIITKEKIKDQKIKKLLSLMKNRGPDGQQFFHINNNKFNYYLFFSRLSILDLNMRSMQPFRFKNLVLIFNGEIYNYLEN
jgi:Asparagine synthase (glutamine-hydrolyzing)